jgi:hypothetical protein
VVHIDIASDHFTVNVDQCALSIMTALPSPSPSALDSSMPQVTARNAVIPTPAPSPTHLPSDLATRLQALEETQHKQEARITMLEHENAELKTNESKVAELLAHITTMEQFIANMAARRREAVSQLLNHRTLHQAASNAFQLRSQDIQPDDLEGVLVAYANSVSAVLNHHQHAIGQLGSNSQYAPHAMPATNVQLSARGYGSYPRTYTGAEWCHAHHCSYPCRICGP